MAILGAWALVGCPGVEDDSTPTPTPDVRTAVTELGFTDYTSIVTTAGTFKQASPMWTTPPTGNNITYSTTDTLPTGITLKDTTGEVSVGADAIVQRRTAYTITATGDGTTYTGSAQQKYILL